MTSFNFKYLFLGPNIVTLEVKASIYKWRGKAYTIQSITPCILPLADIAPPDGLWLKEYTTF